jgi:autotransporter translocation and assembly factor TamB
MDGFEPGELALDLRARQFNVSDTRDVRAVISFDGKLSGTLQRPDLTGAMIVNSANIFLDNFGERTVEEVQLEGETPLEAPSVYDSLSIRMRIQVDPNVWLRNRTSPELAIELLGDMDLLKDRGSDLMAFGSLNTRQGYAMQYGKRFQLERGELAFSGDPFNPSLDIVSLYELRVPEDIEIRYLITGTVDEPKFDFSSSPEMELENIISYTLFGKPFGALFSWQQTFSGGGGGSALARDAAIGVLVDRVESLATESLGIDVLQIDSNRQGETVTTSVKAGKYITDKLFVAVLNELGGSDAVTRVVLEYYVRRNLLFMLTQGNDRRSGVDILWKYEY